MEFDTDHTIKEQKKMAEPYNHREVEQKWQKVWDDERAFATSEILCIGGVSLSFGTGTACRASEAVYRLGYRSEEEADAGI